MEMSTNCVCSDEQAPQPYQYSRFESSRQIRLLRVHSEEGLEETGCTLINVQLDDLPVTYQAISYCWGDQTPKDRIWCCTHRFLTVNESLAILLRYLINSKASGWFW